MQAIEINPEYLRRLDRRYPDLLKHIELFNPDIYIDGLMYCCYSENDTRSGITGKGVTAQEALENWEKCFNTSMAYENN